MPGPVKRWDFEDVQNRVNAFSKAMEALGVSSRVEVTDGDESFTMMTGKYLQ